MHRLQAVLWALALGLILGADASAQLMPQDSWFLSGTWGSAGSGNGQFSAPRGIAVGATGRVFVADTGNNRIQVFESDGTFVRKWGSTGSGDSQFSSPKALDVTAGGHVRTI